MNRPLRSNANQRGSLAAVARPDEKTFISSGFASNFTGVPAATPQPIEVQQQQKQVDSAMDVKEDHAVRDEMEAEETTGTEENTNARPWYRGASGVTKKKPSVRQKRIKRNRTLRKLLTPKNALMALYELKGNQLSEYTIVSDEKGFVATVVVNDKTYDGRGISKIASKNNASEKALRDLIIQKMTAIPKNKPATARADTAGDNADDDDAEAQESGDAEEVPMMHLASFALHKLFTEWQSEGYEIPDFRNGPVATVKEAAPRVTERSELPLNHETMHPSMLLAVMRPATQYIELGHEGVTPNIIHRVGVEVDNTQFVGTGRSKKLARKAAATQACNKLFSCTFVLEPLVAPVVA